MHIAVMTIAGALLWLASCRPTSRYVVRSRTDIVSWTLVSAVISGVLGTRFGMGAVGCTVVIFATGSVVLAEIDLRTRRLPREISYPLFGSMVVSIGIIAWLEGTSRPLVDALVGAAIVTGILLVLHLLSRGGLGDGDVRLAPALGTLAFIGGVETVWTGLFVAFVSAGACVAVLMVSGRASRSSTVPFGPFLIGGALVATLLTTP